MSMIIDRGPFRSAAAVAAGIVLALTASLSPAKADARPHDHEPRHARRVLPELEMLADGAWRARPPADTSDGGLLLDKGRFRRLHDVPGAAVTIHARNNNRGQVVGAYADLSSGEPRVRGFLMQGSRVTTIDVPGAAATVPIGINDHGQVVGGWVGPDATVNPVTGESGPIHGFLWRKGTYEKFDLPGATTTAPYEINNRGWIVGNYADAAGAQHGFVLRDGKVTTIDHPRAVQAENLTGTRVVGVDDRGRLVGSYGDEAGLIHAWKWENGRFTDINPPSGLQAEASQIDQRGRVIGVYFDGAKKRSFVLENGRYKVIDVPDRCDTSASGLNDRGQIVIAAPGTTDGSTCPSTGG